jgi:tetratricopeptide (TPR) repeat protein
LINGRLQEDWGRRRERAILATLLVHAGRWVSIETLIEWAWSEDKPPRNPAQTFHNYATRIRKWLVSLPSSPTLQSGNGAYRLEVDRSHIDYNQFRSLITEARAEARSGNPKRALELAEQALGLWRGRPIEELNSEPAIAWRHRVEQHEWIPAQATLLQALVDIEEFDDALVRLDDLQADDPNDLSLAKLRLSVLHGLARHAERYTYYVRARRRLLDEGDEQAADDLRRHYESPKTFTPYQGLPVQRPVAPDTVPRQLPHDIADFVGRTDLLTALDAATTTPSGERAGGVVVLDGMAGAGKTALTIRWAHRARHRFPDGDLYANLNGFADSPKVEPATVVDDFLIALGHPPDRQMSSRARELLLSSVLAKQQILVLLDNVRDTAHVRELVPLLSNCTVLITSRQRLSALTAATGARRVSVDPMADADVSELISSCLRPRKRIDRNELAHLAPLCGGLPLAAFFLADYIAARPDAEISQFASHLNRQQLIAEIGGYGDGPADLRTFFGWSYQALAAPERRLFRLLGMHPGPDLSVEVACACDGRTRAETVRSLSALVCAHLIEQPEAFDRYRFHDLLREFAADRAQADETNAERQAAMLRYTSFYLSSATNANRLLHPSHLAAPEIPLAEGIEPAEFTDPGKTKQWFERERTNLVAATRSASEVGYYQHVWRLADAIATAFDRRGFYADSRSVRELAVLAAREIGDRDAEGSSLMSLGMVHVSIGDHTEARHYLEAALRLAQEDGHARGQCSTLHHIGRIEMLRGDLAAAVDLYKRALDIALTIADDAALSWSHYRLGEALRLSGDPHKALVHLHQGQWFAERIGDSSAHAYSLAGIGSLYLDRKDFRTAVAYCEQALTIAEAMPDLAVTAQVHITLAEIHTASGDTTAALMFADRAVTICRQTHDLANEAHAYVALGDAHLVLDNPLNALQAWRHAATLYDRLGNHTQLIQLQFKITKVPIR